MNDEQVAAEGAQRFAAQFPGFLKACELLGKVGSVKQAGDEAQSRLDALKAEEATWPAKIEAHNAELARLTAEANAAIQTNADKLSQDAAAQNADIVARRETVDQQAKAILASAATEADRVMKEGNAKAEATKQQSADLASDIAEKTTQLADLTEQTAAAKSKLDGLNAHIEALKAKF